MTRFGSLGRAASAGIGAILAQAPTNLEQPQRGGTPGLSCGSVLSRACGHATPMNGLRCAVVPIVDKIKARRSCRRVFLATAEPFALVAGYYGKAAEPGNRQSRKRPHGVTPGAAFLCLRLPCAPERYRANSEYTPRRLRERRFSTSSGFARLSQHMQEYATRFQLSPSMCASLREASQRHRRGPLSSI